jgi:putative copper export protein
VPSLPATERRTPAGIGAAAVVVAVLAAAAGAAVTGAAAAPALADPGPAVRWGLPAVAALADVAAAVAVGALVLAAAVLPAPAHGRALRVVCAAAVVWAVAGLARLVLGYAAATGQDLGQPDLGSQLASYVTQVDAGRWSAVTVGVAAVVATVAAGASSRAAAWVLTALVLVAVTAGALAGHAGHLGAVAVVALGLHVGAVGVWIGGLAALVLLAPGLAADLGPAATRWAPLAGWAFAVVAGSGVLAAWQQLGGPDGLASGYGAVVLAKTAALVAVGVLGVLHRRRVLPAVGEGRRDVLVRAAVVELVVALLAIGLSAALASSDPPARAAASPRRTLAAVAGH